MPVYRFRTFAEVERSLWLDPGDPRIWEAARRRWALHRALDRRPGQLRRGVFKYRSVDEKQQADNAV